MDTIVLISMILIGAAVLFRLAVGSPNVTCNGRVVSDIQRCKPLPTVRSTKNSLCHLGKLCQSQLTQKLST